MENKIKTPIVELIEQFESELHHESTRQGLQYAIEISKRMLKKEQKIMCWFAQEWHEMKIKTEY
jgi:Ni,Fe-hydrogenase III component G